MLDEIAEQIKSWAAKTYKETVPSNARAYIKGAIGDQSPIDESFFSEAEIGALRRAAARGWKDWTESQSVDHAINKLPDDDRLRLSWLVGPEFSGSVPARNQEVKDIAERNSLPPSIFDHIGRSRSRPTIQYDNYDSAWRKNGEMRSMLDILNDPSASAATTIGRALIERTEDGSTILTDRYKFNGGEGEAANSLFGVLDRLGERIIPDRRGFDVRVDLGVVPSDSVGRAGEKYTRSPDIDLSRLPKDYLYNRPEK